MLLIEQQSKSGTTESNLGLLLSATAGVRCDHVTWNDFTPNDLSQSVAQLIVASAVPPTAGAWNFFEWLRRHVIAAPTLAVLPADAAEGLVQSALAVVDDFTFCPIRESELAQRVTRLLGPERSNVESVRDRLTGEMGLSQLVGNDPAFTRLVEQLPSIARSDAPVLITGETGTGKELFARAIHSLGKRRVFPFIAVDCAAVPDHLFENEFFGHARGAFTDAHRDQRGLVAMAEGGTLFVDEVDALSPAAQVKVLRFLQERTYRPLGADRFERADVNIIAASNRDLESCVQNKQFRSDLYFRLNVLRVCLPPLRERQGDVVLLASHFLKGLRKTSEPIRKSFSAAALQNLALYNWPGNIRELFNVVQRAAVLSEGSQILPNSLSLPNAPSALAPVGATFRRARAAFERAYVEELLRKHHGNITHAASEAQKDRRAFGRLVKKYNVDPNSL